MYIHMYIHMYINICNYFYSMSFIAIQMHSLTYFYVVIKSRKSKTAKWKYREIRKIYICCVLCKSYVYIISFLGQKLPLGYSVFSLFVYYFFCILSYITLVFEKRIYVPHVWLNVHIRCKKMLMFGWLWIGIYVINNKATATKQYTELEEKKNK